MNNRAQRVERLRAARTADSQVKRTKAIETAHRLGRSGVKITVARVAREAGVSIWLIYNAPEVRDVVQVLIAQQASQGISSPPVGARAVTSSSLLTDLALAREEIKELRSENKKYRERLGRALGAEAEAASMPELAARVRELEALNASQHRQLISKEAEVGSLRSSLDELRDELEGKTEALRRMMHLNNGPRA